VSDSIDSIVSLLNQFLQSEYFIFVRLISCQITHKLSHLDLVEFEDCSSLLEKSLSLVQLNVVAVTILVFVYSSTSLRLISF